MLQEGLWSYYLNIAPPSLRSYMCDCLYVGVCCLFVCLFCLFACLFSWPTHLAWLALCSCAGCRGSDATPPGGMDPKPLALGDASCRTGIMGTRGLFSPPIWWLSSRVEVVQTAHCSGASTNTQLWSRTSGLSHITPGSYPAINPALLLSAYTWNALYKDILTNYPLMYFTNRFR